jgi:hypothetical protein
MITKVLSALGGVGVAVSLAAVAPALAAPPRKPTPAALWYVIGVRFVGERTSVVEQPLPPGAAQRTYDKRVVEERVEWFMLSDPVRLARRCEQTGDGGLDPPLVLADCNAFSRGGRIAFAGGATSSVGHVTAFDGDWTHQLYSWTRDASGAGSWQRCTPTSSRRAGSPAASSCAGRWRPRARATTAPRSASAASVRRSR